MPKVSVVIPNYNHAQFLEKRIQSVLNQTYQDFEIIYIDDASTDYSNAVYSKFADDKRMRAVFNEVNSGIPFKQWNEGIRVAQGEYIWIAESDDYADKRLLSELVEKLDQNPTVGLAYCHSHSVDECGNIQKWSFGERWERDFINNGKDECTHYLIVQNTILNASAVLIRRDVYEKAGCADESMVFCGDWMTWVKMLLISDVAFVAEPLNYYRRHSGSVTFKVNKTPVFVEERYRVMRYITYNLNVLEEVLEQVCESMIYTWLDILWSKQGRIEWDRIIRIYQVASDVDSKLKLRLVKIAPFYLLRKIRFLAPIARFVRRVKSAVHTYRAQRTGTSAGL